MGRSRLGGITSKSRQNKNCSVLLYISINFLLNIGEYISDGKITPQIKLRSDPIDILEAQLDNNELFCFR